MRIRTFTLILAVAVTAGVTGFVFSSCSQGAVDDSTTTAEPTVAPGSEVFSLEGVLGTVTGQVVAVVRDATILDTTSDEWTERRLWEVTIDELLFVVDRESAPNARPMRRVDDLPPLAVSDQLVVMEAYSRSGGQAGFDFDLRTEEPILLLLTLNSDVGPAGEAIWNLKAAASVFPDGTLSFLHGRYGEAWNQHLALLEEELAWEGTSAELMAAWSAERWLHADTDVTGSIDDAYTRAFDELRVTFLERWQATEPRGRSLRPGWVPDEILETLVLTEALVAVPDEARDPDARLIVYTDLGVIHSADLTAGNHSDHFFAPPGSTWYVAISRGTDEMLIARIEPDEWETATDGAMVLIALDADIVADETPIGQDHDPHDIVSVVSAADALELMTSWIELADEGGVPGNP